MLEAREEVRCPLVSGALAIKSRRLFKLIDILAITFFGIAVVSLILGLIGLHFYWNNAELLMLICVISIVLAIVIGFVAVSQQESQNEDACNKIGGSYVVVDTDTTYILVNNVMMPHEIDVYGCVK
jgi:hypothetical protein